MHRATIDLNMMNGERGRSAGGCEVRSPTKRSLRKQPPRPTWMTLDLYHELYDAIDNRSQERGGALRRAPVTFTGLRHIHC